MIKCYCCFPVNWLGTYDTFCIRAPLLFKRYTAEAIKIMTACQSPITGCQWLGCVRASVYNWERSLRSNKNNKKKAIMVTKFEIKHWINCNCFNWEKSNREKGLKHEGSPCLYFASVFFPHKNESIWMDQWQSQSGCFCKRNRARNLNCHHWAGLGLLGHACLVYVDFLIPTVGSSRGFLWTERMIVSGVPKIT